MPLPRFSAGGWLAVVFIGAGSGIGYYLWLWALHHASATEVTVFLALSPITAAWLGALMLGERTSPASVLGLALVALGLWVAHREILGGGLDGPLRASPKGRVELRRRSRRSKRNAPS